MMLRVQKLPVRLTVASEASRTYGKRTSLLTEVFVIAARFRGSHTGLT